MCDSTRVSVQVISCRNGPHVEPTGGTTTLHWQAFKRAFTTMVELPFDLVGCLRIEAFLVFADSGAVVQSNGSTFSATAHPTENKRVFDLDCRITTLSSHHQGAYFRIEVNVVHTEQDTCVASGVSEPLFVVSKKHQLVHGMRTGPPGSTYNADVETNLVKREPRRSPSPRLPRSPSSRKSCDTRHGWRRSRATFEASTASTTTTTTDESHDAKGNTLECTRPLTRVKREGCAAAGTNVSEVSSVHHHRHGLRPRGSGKAVDVESMLHALHEESRASMSQMYTVLASMMQMLRESSSRVKQLEAEVSTLSHDLRASGSIASASSDSGTTKRHAATKLSHVLRMADQAKCEGGWEATRVWLQDVVQLTREATSSQLVSVLRDACHNPLYASEIPITHMFPQ